jgi:hypothetical protein
VSSLSLPHLYIQSLTQITLPSIIPQPDYLCKLIPRELWMASIAYFCSPLGASMIDGGWSKYDQAQAVAQLKVLIQVVSTLDSQYAAGKL